jgi:hypothetical protein
METATSIAIPMANVPGAVIVTGSREVSIFSKLIKTQIRVLTRSEDTVMADNSPQNPQEAYGSRYNSSTDKGGGKQEHYNIFSQNIGSSQTGKDGGTTYYDRDGNRIYDKTTK